MKKVALAALLIVATPLETLAADIDWAGWYAGAGLGYSEVKGNWKNKQAYFTGGIPIIWPNADQSDGMRTNGMTGSLHAGYNWVVAPKWVVGAEGSWFHADQDNKANDIPGLNPVGNSYAKFTAKDGLQLKARGGYLVSPQTLLYGSAGVAYQRFKAQAVCPADTNVCNPAMGTQSYSSSSSEWGWMLGVGLEHAFTSRWIGRVDYTYADFRSNNFWAMVPVTMVSHGSQAKISPTSQTLTFGVNYKF